MVTFVIILLQELTEVERLRQTERKSDSSQLEIILLLPIIIIIISVTMLKRKMESGRRSPRATD